MFKSTQLFRNPQDLLTASLKALEYKEITIAFERAVMTLQSKSGIAPETLNKAVGMHNRSVERYHTFLKNNHLQLAENNN